MYTIKFTTAYKKGYRRMKKRGADLSLLDDVIETLCRGGTLDRKYKDHTLMGEFSGYHECHIQPDSLLMYLIEDDILTLTLTRTGTHSDLFEM